MYDIAIIGSGPGGYVAALYARRYKKSVCVIEQGPLGGTCLNNGCIPTKSLLNTTSLIETIRNSASKGIIVDKFSIDYEKILANKDAAVERLRRGIETLFRSNNIDLVRGRAKIAGPNIIKTDNGSSIEARNIIIASGSRVDTPANISTDDEHILSSDDILNIKSVPGSLVIIGSGAIGCEFASIFNRLGTKITMIESEQRILPGQSQDVSMRLESILKKRGIDIFTSDSVSSVSRQSSIVTRLASSNSIDSDKVLVSTGRKANIEDLGLEAVGIPCKDGTILVDGYLRTKIPNIFAIGDCVSGPLLAHRASYDALVACDNICGTKRSVDYTNLPNCIWTDPEIASVGMSENQIKSAYPEALTAKFPYLASGKAFIDGKTEGFVKITGTGAGQILRVDIFGSGACDLIGEAALARTAGITIQQWRMTVHGHPTLSEILQEACGAFCGNAIHSI